MAITTRLPTRPAVSTLSIWVCVAKSQQTQTLALKCIAVVELRTQRCFVPVLQGHVQFPRARCSRWRRRRSQNEVIHHSSPRVSFTFPFGFAALGRRSCQFVRRLRWSGTKTVSTCLAWYNLCRLCIAILMLVCGPLILNWSRFVCRRSMFLTPFCLVPQGVFHGGQTVGCTAEGMAKIQYDQQTLGLLCFPFFCSFKLVPSAQTSIERRLRSRASTKGSISGIFASTTSAKAGSSASSKRTCTEKVRKRNPCVARFCVDFSRCSVC